MERQPYLARMKDMIGYQKKYQMFIYPVQKEDYCWIRYIFGREETI